MMVNSVDVDAQERIELNFFFFTSHASMFALRAFSVFRTWPVLMQEIQI